MFLITDRVVLDPSRVAAQIVTGIGFLGAGLIFVKGDRVTGLTTAATVWLVTGIGTACGAGLPLLALAVTAAYFIGAFVFPRIMRLLPVNQCLESNLTHHNTIDSADVESFELVQQISDVTLAAYKLPIEQQLAILDLLIWERPRVKNRKPVERHQRLTLASSQFDL